LVMSAEHPVKISIKLLLLLIQ